MVTEWGTTNADGDGPVAAEETRRWFDFMEANQLSYLNWSVATRKEGSAALLTGASPKGRWPDRLISASGKFVRDQLRKMNPRYAPGAATAGSDPCGEGTC